ncbi:mucin-7-like [Panicum hallii]|uniref:mucin-7-like n=1 Tax=Panicum hallii TaxID=206008 RepID=UPI000DF4E384|nr:mucin-7-like [Panicum hallii]
MRKRKASTAGLAGPSSSLPSPQRQRVAEVPPTGNDAPETEPAETDRVNPSPSHADDVTIAVAGTVSGQLTSSTEMAPPPAVGAAAIATPTLPAPVTCTPASPATSTVVKKPLKLVLRKPTMIRSQVDPTAVSPGGENDDTLQEMHLPKDDLSRPRQMIKAIDTFALDMNQKTAVKLEESTKRINELMQERAGFEQTIIELQG